VVRLLIAMCDLCSQIGKLPLRGSIALEEGAYVGKSSSRRRALEGSDEDDNNSFEHSDNDIIREAGPTENGHPEGLENEGASGGESDEEEGLDEEDERAGGAKEQEEGEGEEDDLEREYRELREQEE
jgi:hypothetical protein